MNQSILSTTHHIKNQNNVAGINKKGIVVIDITQPCGATRLFFVSSKKAVSCWFWLVASEFWPIVCTRDHGSYYLSSQTLESVHQRYFLIS
jgi:hypothetical protein